MGRTLNAMYSGSTTLSQNMYECGKWTSTKYQEVFRLLSRACPELGMVTILPEIESDPASVGCMRISYPKDLCDVSYFVAMS